MGVQKAAKKMPTAVDGNPDNGLIERILLLHHLWGHASPHLNFPLRGL
jgi:hypothetical protein